MRKFILAAIAAFGLLVQPAAAQVINGGTDFPILAPDGSSTNPSYSFAAETNTGTFRRTTNVWDITIGGSHRYEFSPTQFRIGSAVTFGWSSLGSPTGSADAAIARAAAGSFTFSNASTNSFTVTAGAAGLATFGASLSAVSTVTGSNLQAGGNGNILWTGRIALASPVDGTLSIGNNAGTSSVNIVVSGAGSGAGLATFGGAVTATGSVIGSSVNAGAGGNLGFTGRTQMQSATNGNLRLTNNSGTDFGLLQFGGVSNLFPAWLRSGAGFVARLADDTADTTIQASTVRTSIAYSAAGTALPTCNAGAAGTRAYVTDAVAWTPAAAYVSGGAAFAPVICTGATWFMN